MDIYAVTGRPVLHSKSPEMHNAAFKALSLDACYTRIAAGSAEEALETAATLGVKGMNSTSPFKEQFASLSAKLDEAAAATGSVNCMTMANGKVAGFNTDVDGVGEALSRNGVALKGAKAVVIGAGGAGKSAVFSLVAAGAEVTVMNRTKGKAREVARKFGCSHSSLAATQLGKILPSAEIIVSAISASREIIPASLLQKGTAVLDANYSSQSYLARDARKKGCRVIDAREWLLFQGLRSFEIFTGKKAPVEAMRPAVYSQEKPAMKIAKAGKTPTKGIALVGFMGSGKSSVAREIGRISGMNEVDTDSLVEKSEGMGVASIFREKGEKRFRQLEATAIKKLRTGGPKAIACGGGIVMDQMNVESLRTHCTIVLLTATLPTLMKRVGDPSTRPLLASSDPEATAGKILSSRLSLYAKAADIVVGTEGKTPAEVAEVILGEVRGTG